MLMLFLCHPSHKSVVARNIYIYIYICTAYYMYVYICVYISIFLYLYICVYVYICMYVFICVYVSVFLDCPKMYFQDFQKTHFFRYFSFLHFALKISDENLRSCWGSDTPPELILCPCSWRSSLALFNRFYIFILFLNSWIFQIQFEEHLRMKYSFRILGLSWKNL